MELAAIQISFVGIGVPACQREFRMTAVSFGSFFGYIEKLHSG
jgi:hypothetical protein